ncbi:MAG: aspartate carbamoyltransferase [Candidatus Aenigmatarchaeota archaeon]
MNFKGKDIISIRDLEKREIEKILEEAERMESLLAEKACLDLLKGKILANLFFEPSTRTRLSFASAMQKLGGSVIGFESIEGTSIAKGETLIDTIRTVEKYCNLIVIRHPKEGAARLAAEISEKPVINAGDGANQHPTQTLLDLYTIKKLKGRIEGLNVALVGDLKHGRVMKSLAYALAMFKASLTLVSPVGLEFPEEFIMEILKKFDADIIQTDNIISGIKNADVIYVCRIQKERFEDVYEAEKIQKSFKITQQILEKTKEDAVILHALPKTVEIEGSIDKTKKAKYFDQVYYGIPVRMAVLNLVCP